MNAGIGFALLLSALDGLSTTMGRLMGIFVRQPGPRFMTLTLGFSGGVMILGAFVELLRGGIEAVGLAAGDCLRFPNLDKPEPRRSSHRIIATAALTLDTDESQTFSKTRIPLKKN